MSGLALQRRFVGAVPWLTAASLLVSCVLISQRQRPWFDEIITLVPLRDPSVVHHVRSIAAGAESSPPLYHLLARLWAAVFGAELLPLRLFSSVGFVVALLVLYRTLTRYYAPLAAALATAIVFGGSDLIIKQSAELRYYGLFTAEAAIAFAVLCRVLDREGTSAREIGWGALVAVVLSHAALLYTHVFGIPFSAVLAAGAIVTDFVRRGRIRPAILGAIALAWVSYIPWLPAFAAQRVMSKPVLWMDAPGPRAIAAAYSFEISSLAVFVFALVVAGALAARGWRSNRADETGPRDRTAPLVLAVALLTVPLAAAAISHLLTPLFIPRHLLPAAIGVTVLMAELCQRLGLGELQTPLAGESARLTRAGAVATLAFVALVAMVTPVSTAMSAGRVGPADLELTAAIPPALRDLPVAFESPIAQMQPWFDAGQPADRFIYIHDDSADHDSAAAKGQIAGNKLMRNLERAGYISPIANAADFVRAHDRFIVADIPGARFFERRIQSNPEWQHCLLGSYRFSTLMLVVRHGLALTSCADRQAP